MPLLSHLIFISISHTHPHEEISSKSYLDHRLSCCSFFTSTIVDSFPCPSECICKPTDTIDDDFTRMSYIINCTHVTLNNNKLIYHAQPWSILEDKIVDNER